MEGSILVFCTARPEAIVRAASILFKDFSARTISYVGSADSSFASEADNFLSWGRGPFTFWKIFRLISQAEKVPGKNVILPLNRDDGRGYFLLRLFARYIGGDFAVEVTLAGEIRPINFRSFLDTYRLEEKLFRLCISLLHLFKSLFLKWLKAPSKKTGSVLTKGCELPYTFLRETGPVRKLLASVIIRTYNEERFLSETLDMVFRQENVPMETILIDSESTDATVDIARKFPVRLIKIKKEYFGYGAALNLGARLARGRYVVNLSAHAVPTENNWLKSLVEPLGDDGIAGVHGAEKPIEGHCGLLERKILLDSFPGIPADRFTDSFFSNANSAMRRDLLLENPFDESVAWAEDRLWAKKMQGLGYKTVYRPQAAVYHSHNLSIKLNFERNFKFFSMQFGSYYKDRVDEIRNDYLEDLPKRVVSFRRFLSDRRLMRLPWSLAYALFCEFVNYLGCEFSWEQWNNSRRESLSVLSEPQNQVAS
tara:strand:- start:733 stop:2178 length:1446 start_codon:yes stop_codon:yes gene_type:complete